MTNSQLAVFLVEGLANANINKKIAVFVNRLMLRLHSQPSLMANLADVVAFKPGIEAETTDQVKDGQFHEDQQERRDLNEPDDENVPDTQKQEEEDDDSTVVVQLSFRRLPQEVLSPLVRLLAAPREPKLFRYTKDGSARTGVEIDLKPSDFPGEDYDYAF